jgi:hypothetical protein
MLQRASTSTFVIILVPTFATIRVPFDTTGDAATEDKLLPVTELDEGADAEITSGVITSFRLEQLASKKNSTE